MAKRRHTVHYGVKLDWCCTLANATDFYVQYTTWCCPLSNDNDTMHLVDILFAVHWLSFSWHFFIASNSDYLNPNAFLCYCLNNNNNNNNKLRCLCLTEMKTDRTLRNERITVSSLTGAALWRMQVTFPYNTQSVSYTHLTLPTIYSV